MPNFVHPALLWGLGLMALPILIHLINLWRHRRVDWAAMEFLLESKRKNQRWIVLRQLLLLIARVAAVAALVLVLAQPVLQNRLGALVGAAKTHHVVLLDDSFSMTDRLGQSSAFERAGEAINQLVHRAVAAGPGQYVTLLRFSRAGGEKLPAKPDFHAALADTVLENRLRDAIHKMQPSATSAGPQQALAAAAKLAGSDSGDKRLLYVVSDFRANQWDHPDALRDLLAGWNSPGAEIHFIHCVDRRHENLAVTALRPQRGLLAAAVPFFMDVSIQNFGQDPATNVAVSISEDGQAQPAIFIDEIAPGESETRRVLVNFPTAGQHVISAQLEPDSVVTDNARSQVVTLPVGLPVLLVDGTEEAADARFLSLALAPGGSIRTGIDVTIQPPRYLVDHPLNSYRAIYLTNIAKLDESAITALENFVRSGGGLAIFLGDASDSRFINERLYRSGQGLFPLEVGSPTHLFVDSAQSSPDLVVTNHPIFKIFLGERNSFLNSVGVDRFFSVSRQAEATAGSTAQVIARLRTGAPLVAEKKFGAGRVIAFLTTAAPLWNNWGRNPSFVVAMLEMQSYLINQDEPPAPHLVGSPLRLSLPRARYQPRIRLHVPGEDEPLLLTAEPDPQSDSIEAVLNSTDRPGIYEAELTPHDGHSERRRYAVEVAPEEGNLRLADSNRLAVNLPGLKFADHRAEDLDWTVSQLAGFHLSDAVLGVLVALLIGEQLLAYASTYHPRAWKGSA